MVNPWCATHCNVEINPNRRADVITNLRNVQTVVRKALQGCCEPKPPGAAHYLFEILSSQVAQGLSKKQEPCFTWLKPIAFTHPLLKNRYQE